MRQTPTTFFTSPPLTLSLALIGIVSLPALAQQQPPQEDQGQRIVVTGTRSPKAIDKIPGAITLVTQEDIQHTLSVTEDATAVLARTVPGYAEASQAMSNTGENLRGRIALRLFDGVPQGSPLREGTRNATFTDMGLVGRIEVINGPSASEGIGAAGGIINYISKVPTKLGSETTVTARYTSQFKDDSAGWKLGANYAYKSDRWDFIGGISRVERGMTYDGNGRRIGLNTSGSVADSTADNIFLKGGVNFGQDNEQRLQASLANFKITGNGNYRLVDGDRATGVTNTSEKPGLFGTLTEINDFKQGVLAYSHSNVFGGVLTVDAYTADQAMRYPAENGDDRQDPLIAPLGTLVDQSELRAKKHGLRTSYARQDAFALKGLELRGGVDLTSDKADQRLALTDRLWVPPMKYKSTAPWIQASYETGPVTISGGFRREDGDLTVDDYTTVYSRDRRKVQGGTLSYTANLPNLGVVVKLPAGWSVFAATGKGFTLPNLGIPLRNIQCSNDNPEGTQPDGCPNDPPARVSGIIELQAIIVKNDEVGFNWRGTMGSLSGSYYHSFSEFGQSLIVGPQDFILRRVPVDIKGFELSGELRFGKTLKANALYSRTRGKTEFVAGGPLDKEMGVNDINPDKIGLSGTWSPGTQSTMTLGATTLMSRDINIGRGTANGEEHTKGYTLFDFSAKYDFGRYGATTLGIENLTDKQYILSWSQVVGFRNYWAGRGRVVSLTHTVTF